VKKAVIFGDSYSTFEGYIPEGYATYYADKECDNTDVRKVKETWWNILSQSTGLDLVLNNSWSGSTVCYTAYNGRDCSADSSFIYRLERLIEDGFFENEQIDTVFVFGGTNDSWANSPLGELKFSDISRDDLFCVLPAISYLIGKLRDTLPSADIVCIANTEIKPEIIEAIELSAKHYGARAVTLSEIDKRCGHPTVRGMAQIAEQVEKIIL